MEYEPRERTPFETQYVKFIEDIPNETDRKSVRQHILSSEIRDVRNPHFKEKTDANEDFIRTYNERAKNEKREIKKRLLKDLVNETGKKYARFWEHQGFREIHDPMSK
jgi:hypothetical protein